LTVNPRHDWNSWDHYLSIHESYLKALEHFVLDNQLFHTVTDDVVYWNGVLYCTGNIEIRVSKKQDVEVRGGRPMVRTTEYRYHVLRRTNDVTVNLFRYDNIHVQPGHDDRHHRHRYDADGNEIEPPMWVGESGWPTLSEVITEAFRWNTPGG
jgi:hypothetical protein